MASSTDPPKNENLNCSICLETYRSPRSLPCLHTFCQPCLQTYIDDIVEKGELIENCFTCPVCRKPFKPADESSKHSLWASLFPFNYALLSLLESPSSTMSIQHCAPCLADDDTKEAMKYCLECEELLCNECIKSHQRFNKLKGHRLVDLSEIGQCKENTFKIDEAMTMCSIHPRKILEYYCKDDGSLCCATCSIVNHRKCQEIVEIAAVADGIKEGNAMAALKKDIEILAEHVSDVREVVKKKGNAFAKQVLDIPRKFKKAKDSIIIAMDKVENEVESRCRELHKTENVKTTEEMDNFERIEVTLRNTLGMIDALGKHGSNPELFVFLQKAREQKNTSEEMIKTASEALHVVSTEDSIEDMENKVLKLVKDSTLLKICSEKLTVKACAISVHPDVEFDSVIEVKPEVSASPMYSGACVFPCGEILLAGPYYVIIDLFDSSFRSTSCIWVHVGCLKIVAVDTNSALVTIEGGSYLQKISILKSGSMSKEIILPPINGPYSGLCKTNDGNILLGTASKVIYILSLDCQKQIRKPLERDKSGRVFKSLLHLAILPSTTILLQSCAVDNAVYCFDYLDGTPHFKYSHKELSGPAGIDTDKWSCIYICGEQSHNIHQLTSAGDLINIIVADTMQSPLNLCFLPGGEDFIVTSSTKHRTLHKFRVNCK